jgi:hypothetical protein
MRLLVAGTVFQILAIALVANASAQTFIYGGPLSLEGKFEDESGSFDRQGWLDVRCDPGDEYWQVSTFMADNLNNHGSGNHALWAGQTAAQQPDYTSAPGYGNNWRAAAEWSAVVADPGSAVEVGLEFYYNYDSEPGYDYFMVEWYDGTFWNELLSLSGTSKVGGVFIVPGEFFSEVWTVQPSEFSGPNQNEVRLRLFVRSDGGVSDHDPLLGFQSDGAAQVDDIRVTFDGVEIDGGGDPDGLATFEAGDDEGWTPLGSSCVCAGLTALPQQYEGAATNPTPAIARINDASVRVAGRCTFIAPRIYWVTPEALDGAYLEFDSYFWSTGRLGFTNYQVDMTWKVAGVWQPAETVFTGDMPSPGWQNIMVDLTEIAPADADSVTMRILTGFGDGLTDVVAIDNVALGRYDTAVAAPPAAGRARLRVSPNPANPMAEVQFDLERSSPVALVVYDVRGRLVRRLESGEFGAGTHQVQFDGRDDRGRALASGIYFVRLETPQHMLAKRVTLVK